MMIFETLPRRDSSAIFTLGLPGLSYQNLRLCSLPKDCWRRIVALTAWCDRSPLIWLRGRDGDALFRTWYILFGRWSFSIFRNRHPLVWRCSMLHDNVLPIEIYKLIDLNFQFIGFFWTLFSSDRSATSSFKDDVDLIFLVGFSSDLFDGRFMFRCGLHFVSRIKVFQLMYDRSLSHKSTPQFLVRICPTDSESDRWHLFGANLRTLCVSYCYLTTIPFIVPEAGFEPAHPNLDATPSRWCVYQFHHSGWYTYYSESNCEHQANL